MHTSSHRHTAYWTIAIWSSIALLGSLYQISALTGFTNQVTTITGVCPVSTFGGITSTCSSSDIGKEIVDKNGTYNVCATNSFGQKKCIDKTINNIDMTRPVAKAVDYAPTSATCTKWSVKAKVTFFDGLNTIRQKDRISWFQGGEDAQKISTRNYAQYPWCKNNGCIDTHIQKLSKEYTFSSNGSYDEYATDLAGNTSLLTQINSTSVNWIKSTSPTITNLVLTPGITGMIPFSFDIVDNTMGLASSCQNMTINWSITITVGSIPRTISGIGRAGDHVTGNIIIPWAGDYTLTFGLTDAVSNSNTRYAWLSWNVTITSDMTTSADGTTVTSNQPIINTQSSNSRVKILGAIGGQRAYDSVYSVGSKFDSSLFASILNQMRKNVALLTRNVDLSSGEKTVNNIVFIKGNKRYSAIDTTFPSNTDSLILIWGDLIIDRDILNTSSKPKGIIVIKNEAGDGGNVYISGSVTRIQSSIFTEWSVFSGDSPSNIYNTTTASLASLPSKQLYIQGSLVSRNTILGGLTGICTYNIDCTASADTAYRYDLNYFRNFASGSTADRAYPDNSLDVYSLIIERDPRISDTPPPGWENK